jgi:NDP-sugar pyrophosphorylase family protein
VEEEAIEVPRPAHIPAFILAGGEGTRLQGFWSGPKALVPVEGRPFISYLLDELERGGFRRIILLTGKGASEVEGAVGDRNVVSLREPRPLGTGGALRAAAPLARDWNVILNGDSFCSIPWGDFLMEAARQSSRLCVMTSKVSEADSFGSVDVSPDGKVRAFREKVASGPRLVNAGVYAARGDFFRFDLAEEAGPDPLSLETRVLPAMAREGGLGAWVTDQPFWDVGTPARLEIFRRRVREERG